MDGSDRKLPEGSVPGRRTPTFTHESVPPGLLKSHHTSVWATLVVISGSVEFVEENPEWHTIATPGNPAVIVPNRPHHIQPTPDAEFHVQFYSPDVSAHNE